MVDFKKLLAERRVRHDIENRGTINNNLNVSISVAGSDYALSFGYDSALLRKLKDAIPESERAWHKGRKVWLISPEEIGMAINVIRLHTGHPIELPTEKPITPELIEKSFLLEYLGATKDRGKKISAYGSVNGQWSVEFSEEVLKGFFEGRETNQKPDGLQTLYQVLCVVESSQPEQIKKAYKRLALHHHPDVSKEEGSEEKFIQINEAYKVLINPEQRKRYDAGLYFERQGHEQESRATIRQTYDYRAPLRCGQVTAKGTVRLMRFVVSEILGWDDVINLDGKVMSSTWPKGADTFQILWV